VALVFQVIVAIVLVAFVVRKAREELDRAVEAKNNNDGFLQCELGGDAGGGFEAIFKNNNSDKSVINH